MYKRFGILTMLLVLVISTSTAFAATSKRPTQVKKAVGKASAVKPTAKTVQTKSLPRLLDLGADKCIPCKMMVSVLDGLKKDYKGKLTVDFIDVWKNSSASAKYKIKLIPTQIFYDNKGKEVFRHEGYFSKEDIVAAFKKNGIKL